MTSCGTNSSLTPASHGASTFAVTLENGSGSFTPQVAVSNDATGPVVTVSTTDAQNISGAFMHLSYDSTKYTPVSVDFGNMLGQGDEVLTLAVTTKPSDVPMGITQVGASGILPVSGAGTLATVHFTATPFVGRNVSGAVPTPGINKVKDLKIISQDAQSMTLQWTENHPGDTDNNGEANLADLQNIGKYLHQVVADASDPLTVGMADTNGDGEVTPSDLTNLGINLGTVVDGYILYTDAGGTQTYANGMEVKRSDYQVLDDANAKNHPIVYTFTVQLAGLNTPAFSVAPVAPSLTAQPGPQSNTAQITIVDGAPDTPTNFNAETGASIGNGKVKLTWTASTVADLAGYVIERATVNPPGPVIALPQVSSSATSYIDSDATLTSQAYSYTIKAVDNTSLFSDLSPAVVATPFFPPPPATPTGFTAVTSPTDGAAVHITAAAGDATHVKFAIYREGPGESSFTKVYTTAFSGTTLDRTDDGLTPLTDYQYYVTAVGASGVESGPTATLTAKSSEAPAVNIVSVTTDKTTHCNSGAEVVSHITVTTDLPADSIQVTGPGVISISGMTATWKPNGSTPLGLNTLTVTAKKGSKTSNPKDLSLFVTSKPILTQYGTQGKFIDFNDRASVRHPSQPYYAFSNYADGKHVVDFNLWGTWCGPCQAELPACHKWATHYAGSFYYVGMNDFNGDTVAAATSYFNSHGYDNMDSYNPWHQDIWHDHYGEGGYVPVSILFDQDGYARLWFQGGISGTEEDKWNTTISECTGMPKAT